jgi:hypothetical protein
MKTEKNEEYFRNTSFPLANFLYAHGQKLVSVDSLNGSIKEFVFVMNERLQELEDKYKFGDKNDPDLLVHVHTYEEARRQLLSFIKDHGIARKF